MCLEPPARNWHIEKLLEVPNARGPAATERRLDGGAGYAYEPRGA